MLTRVIKLISPPGSSKHSQISGAGNVRPFSICSKSYDIGPLMCLCAGNFPQASIENLEIEELIEK